MSGHPYEQLPDHCFWGKAVANAEAKDIDLFIQAPFRLSSQLKIATAGSCFAQHIARYLRKNGVQPYIVEPRHPLASQQLGEKYGYGVFSARYGNVYTSRQLLQLMRRAFGVFTPKEDHWPSEQGRLVDPFRPRIHPGGFLSLAELRADRRRHLALVRKLFTTLDVLIFTLGLTETWTSRQDGAAYPLCPGVAGGIYDESRHAFVNLELGEVVDEMSEFIANLAIINPKARIILTVSPVSLNATAVDRHVVVSTVYSKSVLRVACEQLERKWPNVVYFPSYEIITGPQARGRYFEKDGRGVTEAGVRHVMGVFLKHFIDPSARAAGPPAAVEAGVPVDPPVSDPTFAAEQSHQRHMKMMEKTVQAMCDEEALGRQ